MKDMAAPPLGRAKAARHVPQGTNRDARHAPPFSSAAMRREQRPPREGEGVTLT
ncbi:MAG: hypothetical protein ACK4Q4_05140 [Rhodocyclaceae bacterium]